MDTQNEDMEEIMQEPMSPNSQYICSSVISLAVIAVLESEIPIQADASLILKTVKEIFLPMNPRFSSIMVEGKNGVKSWRKVEVIMENHARYPVFPEEAAEVYDESFNGYLSRMALTPFSEKQPPWEVHIVKYPTKDAAGHVVFKLHHALGDGYSLMALLLSCLTPPNRNPSLPIILPQVPKNDSPVSLERGHRGIFRNIGRILSTISDFTRSMMRSTIVGDDPSPIKFGIDGVQFKPMNITTVAFSIDQIKQMKTKLHASINDVICGVIFLGTRLYMQKMNSEKANANSTALVLMNTRAIRGYKTVKEMMEPNTSAPWGNHFAFLHVSLPMLDKKEAFDPLSFVLEAQKTIKYKRNSAGVLLTAKLLQTLHRFGGPEMSARLLYKAFINSSMGFTNVIGPVHQLALANHPIKGMYFVVTGSPQSLGVTMLSYMQKLRVVIASEKETIDAFKFKSSIEEAFTMIRDAVTKLV